MERKQTRLGRRVIAAILLVFTMLTLFMSSAVLFDWLGIREKEGHYVEYIVWTNFLCAWLYLPAIYGFLNNNKWTIYFLATALVILVIAFNALQLHIARGGDYETKTVRAMLFRIGLTLIFTLLSYFKIYRKR